MRLTAATKLFSLTGAASVVFMGSAVFMGQTVFAGQAAAEQDFHPIWCPQATSAYVSLREALDPLRAATVAHDLDIAKAGREGKPARPGTKPPVGQHYNEDQPPYTADGNSLQPRHPSPAVPPPPAPPQPADQFAVAPAAPTGPAPVKQWTWDDPDVQDGVQQFEEKAPLLFRRLNTIVAETWWAELQDAGGALSGKFGEIVGDEREEVSAQDLTRDWISLEEQYDVVKNLCIGWGETAVPGVAPPGQPEWPVGSSPDTARPPGIENSAWPHTPGWVDVPVPDPDDPDSPPPPHRPFTPLADENPTPLASPGCERYDYRSGGWGQHAFCPDDAGQGDSSGPDDTGDSAE